MNYIISYTTFPTNQSFNDELFKIAQEAALNKKKEMSHEAVCVCSALEKINLIHKDMLENKQTGATTAEIEKLMEAYQLPINNDECKIELEKIGNVVKNAWRHSVHKKTG